MGKPNLPAITALLELTTEALRRKLAERQSPEYQKAVVRELCIKQHEEFEDELVDALKPVFRRQIEDASKGLAGLVRGTKHLQGQLARQFFNPRDYDEALIDAALPVLARKMGEAAVAQVLLMGGEDPRKEKGWWRKHLQGQHDQQSHGRGGSSMDNWTVPKDATPSPTGERANFTPAKGGYLFHGTAFPDDVEYVEGDKDGVAYFTDDFDEALGYSSGAHLGGSSGGTQRVIYQQMAPGKMLDLDMEITEAVTMGDDFGPIFENARRRGADYVFYRHPSFKGDGEQRVIVALNPEKTLGSIDSGWTAEGRRWRRPRKRQSAGISTKSNQPNTRLKASTATEWLAREGLDPPPGISTEFPPWLVDEIDMQLREVFEQDFWKKINDSTLADINGFIDKGIKQGMSFSDIAAQIKTEAGLGFEYYRRRSLTIARTECLPAETRIDGAKVVAAHRRFYSGPWVEIITEGGRKFSGTPNHPMLTTRGWVALGDLTEEDNLIANSSGIESASSSGDVDVKQPPTTIKDVFDAVAAVGVHERRCTTNEDFHGDGHDGYVDVFSADGLLSYGTFASIKQDSIDRILPESDVEQVLLACESLSMSSSLADAKARLGAVSDFEPVSLEYPTNCCLADPVGLCNVGTVLASQVPLGDLINRIIQILCIRAVARCKHVFAGFFERSCDTRSFAGELNNTRITRKDDGDFDAAQARNVQVDHPLIIRRIESWSGHVYNLTTRDGYFIADGLYTGNSGNALNAGRRAGIDGMARDLAGVARVRTFWFSILANTTRDSHANMDGKEADADGLFELSGVRVPWPGHWKLSARERISCMCSLRTELDAPDGLIPERSWQWRKHLQGQHDQQSHGRGGAGAVAASKYLNKNKSLEEIESYDKSTADKLRGLTEKSFEDMPEGARKDVLKNMKSMEFYGDIADLQDEARKDFDYDVEEKTIQGLYDPRKRQVHVDGADMDEDEAIHVIQHEMAHSLDARGSVSNGEFLGAWASELSDGELTDYAATDPEEGFAEFAAFAWRNGAEAKKRFPMASEVFEKRGWL